VGCRLPGGVRRLAPLATGPACGGLWPRPRAPVARGLGQGSYALACPPRPTTGRRRGVRPTPPTGAVHSCACRVPRTPTCEGSRVCEAPTDTREGQGSPAGEPAHPREVLGPVRAGSGPHAGRPGRTRAGAGDRACKPGTPSLHARTGNSGGSCGRGASVIGLRTSANTPSRGQSCACI
jgi:hypothetical protein